MITHRTEAKPESNPGSTIVEILKTAFQHIDQGILLLREDRTLVFVNKRAYEILGLENEGKAADFVEHNCPEGIFTRSDGGENAVTYLDVTLPGHKQRKLLGLEVHCLQALLPDRGCLILIHDFSKWKRLDEMRARFATSLSHRMRTPLTAISNAVKLLGDKEKPVSAEESEKLIDIGWRNIEKLIANLDELQKVFMIESEEMSVCRTLIRVKKEMKPLLSCLEQEGRIKGFKMKVTDSTLLTGRSRLQDFISTAIDAYAKWMGEEPFIECKLSLREDFHHVGGIDRKYKLSLIPRFNERPPSAEKNLKDFLSYREAHRGLVLDRLANALEGEMEISPGNYISLLVPTEPAFNREKDLLHPLHMMLERSELTGGAFHLISLRLVGLTTERFRFKSLIERCLCKQICEGGIVSKGEEPLGYSIFVSGRSTGEVNGMMEALHNRFVRSCCERGEELYPSIRWDVRFSRIDGETVMPSETCLLEELI
jgi:hypothetical protein